MVRTKYMSSSSLSQLKKIAAAPDDWKSLVRMRIEVKATVRAVEAVVSDPHVIRNVRALVVMASMLCVREELDEPLTRPYRQLRQVIAKSFPNMARHLADDDDDEEQKV